MTKKKSEQRVQLMLLKARVAHLEQQIEREKVSGKSPPSDG